MQFPATNGDTVCSMTLKDFGNLGHAPVLRIQPDHVRPVSGALGHRLSEP